MKSSKLFLSAVLILGIVIMTNLLLGEFSLRFDLTEDKQYTLSDATKNMLAELEEPITVKAFFSEELQPEIAKTKTDFRELLQEYAERSDGMLVYEFLDPNKDEEIKQNALQAGVQPTIISVREKNELTQKEAFMGAVLEMREEKEVIPLLPPNSPLEYTLTTSIKKLAVLDKPSVGLIQGHGEPDISEMIEVYNNLSVLYSFEPLRLNDTLPIPDRFQTIALVRPTDSIPPDHLNKLDDFLGRGGQLFVAINRVNGDLQQSRGVEITTGLEGWLKEKGIEVDNKFIVDASCGAVSVSQQRGFFTTMNQIKFPYLPIIQKFAAHPITKGLEAAVFQFASEVKPTGTKPELTFTPIAFSSEKSGTAATPLYFNIQKQWTDRDFPSANIPVAGILEGNIVGDTPAKIVVIGDGDFPINGSRQQFQQLQPDNVSLMVNSIDWLSDDTGLIDLRTKGIASRPIDQLEESTQNLLSYLNFLLPIILVILYGFIRSQRNKQIRIKRQEESYVNG